MKNGTNAAGKPMLGRRLTYIIAVAIAVVVASTVVLDDSSQTVRTVRAQSEKGQKKYRATRRIVKDSSTGQFRLPTEQEAQETIADLARLTQRPESLPSSDVAAGGVAVDLEDAFAGTFVARPKEDGTMETRCVFTLEEALEFLGFVEVAE